MKLQKLVEQEIELPPLPDLIRGIDGREIFIREFSLEELKQIGEAWTEALIKKATFKEKHRPKIYPGFIDP